jgi:ribose transport system ATP-binding protein
MINELADSGIAIILISSDLPEVLSLSDNFLIMHEGMEMGYLPKEEANEESVLRLALGLNGN